MRPSRARQLSNISRTRCDWRRRLPTVTPTMRVTCSHSRAEEARAFLQSALELSPTDLTARELLNEMQTRDAQTETLAGDALLHQGKISEAISHYETALKIAPDSTSTLNNLAWALSTSPDATLRDERKSTRASQESRSACRREEPNFHSDGGCGLCRGWPFQRGNRERSTRVAARSCPAKLRSGQEAG